MVWTDLARPESAIMTSMADFTPKLRWFRLTPDRIVIVLLIVECLLWLAERLPWPGLFYGHKGWPVLIAVIVVGATILAHPALVRRGPALSLAVPIQYSVVAGAGCGDRYRVQLACGEVTADQARAESGGGD